MLQQLINHNPEILRLQEEGYDLEVRGGYLLIHHIPSLNSQGDLIKGTLVMQLQLSGDKVIKPNDHTAYWCGEKPCLETGAVIPSLINGPKQQNLGFGINTNFFLSCFPDSLPGLNGSGYPDYYTKVNTYFSTISGPAIHKFPDARERVRDVVVPVQNTSRLRYADTNSSKSHTAALNEIWKNYKVAVVGLGGTGAYLLDFLAKMDLAEIHLFDDDAFNTHNAFRSPGAPTLECLTSMPKKVDYFQTIYDKMHSKITPHAERITSDNINKLYDMNVVFICVDDNDARCLITRKLSENGVSFIDSGLGLYQEKRHIGGMVRVTTGYPGNYDHLKDAFGASKIENPEDPYKDNIQVADINALAAILMLVQWKRTLGYYQFMGDLDLNFVYNIGDNRLYGQGGN